MNSFDVLLPSMRSWLLLAILSIIWGCSFILIKRSLLAFDPVQVAAWRIAISGIAFLPMTLRAFRRVSKKDLPSLLAVGIFGSAFPAFLYAYAQTEVASADAGILNSLTPLFTLIFGILMFRQKTSWLQTGGVIVGFAGAAILVLEPASTGESSMFHALLIVIATMCYATSVNTVKKFLQNVRALDISAISYFLIGVPAIIMLFWTDSFSPITGHEDGWLSWGSVAVLAVFGTALGSVFFFRLTQITDAVFASSVSYTIPFVALAWGIWDGEPIGLQHLVSILLVLLGVYLVKKK